MTASTSPVTRFFAFNPSLDTFVFPQLSLSGLKDICVDYLEVRNVGRQSLESIPRYIKMMRQTYCYYYCHFYYYYYQDDQANLLSSESESVSLFDPL